MRVSISSSARSTCRTPRKKRFSGSVRAAPRRTLDTHTRIQRHQRHDRVIRRAGRNQIARNCRPVPYLRRAHLPATPAPAQTPPPLPAGCARTGYASPADPDAARRPLPGYQPAPQCALRSINPPSTPPTALPWPANSTRRSVPPAIKRAAAPVFRLQPQSICQCQGGFAEEVHIQSTATIKVR